MVKISPININFNVTTSWSTEVDLLDFKIWKFHLKLTKEEKDK